MIVEISTPMYGGQCTGPYLNSIIDLIKLLEEQDITVLRSQTTNESLIQRARNNLASGFLSRGSAGDKFVFIDADIEFDPKAMVDMIMEDKDVIGAVTPLKYINIPDMIKAYDAGAPIESLKEFAGAFNINVKLTPKHLELILEDKPFEVDRIGTGVMCIKWETLNKMSKIVTQYYDDGLQTKGSIRYDFFPVTIEYDESTQCNRLMSEDYNFCNQWVKMGGEIYAKSGIVKSHSGYHKYTGEVQNQIKLISNETK